MKKIFVMLLMAMASYHVQAYDYPYLAFQTTDGTVTTLSVESLGLTISNGQLTATNSDGSKTFVLSELSKMYFTTEGATEGVEVIDLSSLVNDGAVYDLLGRQLSQGEKRRGVYIVKTNKATHKVSVK